MEKSRIPIPFLEPLYSTLFLEHNLFLKQDIFRSVVAIISWFNKASYKPWSKIWFWTSETCWVANKILLFKFPKTSQFHFLRCALRSFNLWHSKKEADLLMLSPQTSLTRSKKESWWVHISINLKGRLSRRLMEVVVGRCDNEILNGY